jgi:hypothetical protein
MEGKRLPFTSVELFDPSRRVSTLFLLGYFKWRRAIAPALGQGIFRATPALCILNGRRGGYNLFVALKSFRLFAHNLDQGVVKD